MKKRDNMSSLLVSTLNTRALPTGGGDAPKSPEAEPLEKD